MKRFMREQKAAVRRYRQDYRDGSAGSKLGGRELQRALERGCRVKRGS
ncbi:hypothetical protein KCP71_01150 [Salmonella enterica subsp. enterica]|nr:hypothetical protein KCP71_01150 [Salmonella enterica subsp. enterica]